MSSLVQILDIPFYFPIILIVPKIGNTLILNFTDKKIRFGDKILFPRSHWVKWVGQKF